MTFGLYFAKYTSGGGATSRVTVTEFTKDQKGNTCVSPDATTFSELEGYIEELKHELDEVKKRAKKKYSEIR